MGFLFLLGIISQGLEQANLEYMSFFVFLGRCHTCNLYKTDLIWYNFRPLIAISFENNFYRDLARLQTLLC
jgi:hypothetical protein